MNRTSVLKNNFMQTCMEALPEYFKELKSDGLSKVEISLAKTAILTLLKKLINDIGSKFNQTGFIINAIRTHLSQLDVSKHPELSNSGLSSTTITSILLHFLNYLSLQKILDRNNNLALREWMENENKVKDLKKKPNPFSNNDDSEGLRKEVLKITQDITTIWKDDLRCNEVLYFFEQQPNKALIDVLLQLVQSVEDTTFQKLLFVIDNCMMIHEFPFRVLEILRELNDPDHQFTFRLLILYFTFFLAGYPLKVSLDQLLDELNIDPQQVDEYLSSVFKNDHSHETSSSLFQDDVEEFEQDFGTALNPKKLIDEINPILESDPYSSEISERAFNLPEGIDIKLQEHVKTLTNYLDSFIERVEFINSDWEKWLECVKDTGLRKKLDSIDRYYQGGNFRKALKMVNETKKAYPEVAYVYYMDAKILGDMRSHNNALKSLLKSLELDSKRIESYLDLTLLLELGGYFYHSMVLSMYLLKFTPLDFNLLVQFAFSSYQLSQPFKTPLEIAGRLEPARLVNFLSRFWFYERIAPRDSPASFNMSTEEFSEFLRDSEHIVSKVEHLLDMTKSNPRDKQYIDELNAYLENIQNFFPNTKDHVAKNQAAYELATRILSKINLIFYDTKFVLPYLTASKPFVEFSMIISQVTIEQIIATRTKQRNSTRFEIDTALILNNSAVVNHPMHDLACFFITEEGFSKTIFQSTIELVEECGDCPEKCLDKPYKWCTRFYMFNIPESQKDQASFINFIDVLNAEFYYWLEDKGLKLATIDKKTQFIEHFLIHLISLIKEEDKKNLSKRFNVYLKPSILEGFLLEMASKENLVKSRTAFNHLLNSLKSFIRFYYDEYGHLKTKDKGSSIEYLKNYEIPEEWID